MYKKYKNEMINHLDLLNWFGRLTPEYFKFQNIKDVQKTKNMITIFVMNNIWEDLC